MRQGFTSRHFSDPQNNPEGGATSGVGFCISWQRGPLGRGEDRQPPNGAFVEDVIAACIDRLDFYQRSKFRCIENDAAIDDLRYALNHLASRTRDREARGVEGTHAV